LTTAAASTPKATAQLLRSKMGSSASSVLYRLLWQAQKLGTTLETPLADSHTDRWRLSRCSILHEKTEDSISDPPPPLLDTLLSSTHDTQTCFKNIEPYHPFGDEEQGDKGASCSTDDIIQYSLRSPIALLTPEPSMTSCRSPLREDPVGIAAGQASSPWMWSSTDPTDAEPVTAIGATDIRDSSKRTADSAGLNEGGEDEHRLEKARRAGQCTDPSLYRRV